MGTAPSAKGWFSLLPCHLLFALSELKPWVWVLSRCEQNQAKYEWPQCMTSKELTELCRPCTIYSLAFGMRKVFYPGPHKTCFLWSPPGDSWGIARRRVQRGCLMSDMLAMLLASGPQSPMFTCVCWAQRLVLLVHGFRYFLRINTDHSYDDRADWSQQPLCQDPSSATIGNHGQPKIPWLSPQLAGLFPPLQTPHMNPYESIWFVDLYPPFLSSLAGVATIPQSAQQSGQQSGQPSTWHGRPVMQWRRLLMGCLKMGYGLPSYGTLMGKWWSTIGFWRPVLKLLNKPRYWLL